jgi:diaminopimelate decarboxylase
LAVKQSDLLDRRLALFPLSTQIDTQVQPSCLTVSGVSLLQLAQQYDTPLYIYDQLSIQTAVQRYKQALKESYPAASGITYAGKAFLCTAMAQWVGGQDLWLDCTGAGELAIARSAGFPRSRLLVHGVNKSRADLQAAIEQAGTIVVDNLSELERLKALLDEYQSRSPDLWLRLRPGVAVDTHAYRQTGQEDSKFGMEAQELFQAIQFCQHNSLPLKGIHFHQGSHFHNPTPIGPALDTALDLMSEAYSSFGWLPETLCPGGGWGVPYHEDDIPHQPLENYVQFIAERLREGCQRRELPLPRLQLEPGRSLVAQAGVSIYRVETVKRTQHRRWLMLDGGMADNPRPALYQARYSALPVTCLERPFVGPAWLAGPYCESGDILIEDLQMPDIQAGEYLAIPVSGAYHLSMGSNYNGARRPAVLWLDTPSGRGEAILIQCRETLEDLTRRDLRLVGDGL